MRSSNVLYEPLREHPTRIGGTGIPGLTKVGGLRGRWQKGVGGLDCPLACDQLT